MKTLVFLADGFEEVEALTVVDYLRRAGIEVDTVSITNDNKVKGSHKITVIADKKIEELNDVSLYDAVIIPGGMPGSERLRDNHFVIDIVKKMNEAGKLVAAICAGPIVLAKAGVIKGKQVTSYPGFENELKDGIYVEKPVVRDKNIITSRGPALAVDFAIEIIKYLAGEEKAQKLKKDILYQYLKANN
ncbi:MAG: DJ-1 family glyoxalase III [Defluviitoga tunisiensis]|jgi:4-methyl-5(b-hydroxyethyl)-thiazole monophosphate biosynthesis